MFKLKKRYIPLFLFILLISIPIYGQDAEEPVATTEAPTEIITEAPTDVPTDVPTEVITEAPTEDTVVTEAPTDEAVVTEAPTDETVVTEAPTDETVVTEAPTEDTVITEEPLITPDATEAATEQSPIPTEAPASDIEAAPEGEAVEMILNYNPNASNESVAAMLQSLGAVELERIPQIGAILVQIPSSVANTAAAQHRLQGNALASTAGLLSVEENQVTTVSFTPNDPYFSSQTDLQDGFSGYEIWMETAWSISPRDGQGVVVAVLDTGLDLQHPEFVGKYVPGWDFYNDDNNPDDDNGHGTHVSGTIAAKTNNGIGVAGMAFNAMILPVKVCSSGGSCLAWEVAAGMVYAVDRGAKVMNISLGFLSPSDTMRGAVDYALSRNVVVVAAAGNNQTSGNAPNYPASFPGVISVGAMDTDGNTIAYFSNTSSNVTITAPGVSILSTFPLEYGSYYYLDGTSMASPHVAALAAMLIADGLATTPAQVRENLICTSLDKGAVGYDATFGYGFIQADWSLSYFSNSSACQVSQTNDFIDFATTISSPTFTVTQAVNTRSVTESATDPLIGGVFANQTLWYKFTPATSGDYIFSTIGSSGYDTLLGVYQGMPGALTEIASNDDTPLGAGASWLKVSLARTVTYYVQVGTLGADVTNQFVRLNVNQGSTLTTLQQETATFLRYTGSWSRVAQTGSSGGYVNTTSDDNATLSFLVRGSNISISRIVGPTMGSMEVYVDGALYGTYSNLAAVTRSTALYLNLSANNGEWHMILIKMPDGSVAPLSIDAIQMTNGTLPTGIVGATRVSETVMTTFAYPMGSWTTVGLSNALNANVRRTSDVGAYVEFRSSGTAVTFWRQTGPSTGLMDVYIDNVLVVDDYDNEALDSQDSVPFTIANLPQRERIVRIEHVDGDGDFFSFDGAQSVNQTALVANAITDERSTSIVYSGFWTRSTVPTTTANGGTLTNITGNTDGEVNFMFNGNHFCIGYQGTVATDMMDVYLDGSYLATIDTFNDGNKVEWCTASNGFYNIADTLHSVRIDVAAGNEIHLDYIRAVRRQVFTTSLGYIAESNAGFIYTGVWTTTNQGSLGGSKFQGGSARRADANDATTDTVSFHMSGTGFILYTSLPRAANTGGYEVTVDGVLHSIEVEGVSNNYLDLWGQWDRFRPVGYGVVDLGTGLHYVTLEAIDIYFVSDPLVDFDGIRVLP